MALLNFHRTFAPLVESGEKRQTIRAQRKRPIEIGENLYLYTGCRTKKARRLRDPQVCLLAVPIFMGWQVREGARRFECRVNGCKLSLAELHELARADGFSVLQDFMDWFLPKGTTVFIGQLIQW